MFNIINQSNYLAKLVRIQELRPIEGANTIQIAVIDYNSIITSKDTKIGDLVVYFPIECQINTKLLSYLNLFSDSNLNTDPTKKGFFGKQGRVKCISMLKNTVKSEGFILPVADVISFLQSEGKTVTIPGEIQFDYYDDIQICQKYEPPTARNNGSGPVKSTNKLKHILVDGQFEFYGDTSHLKANIHRFELDDLVVITNKVHGSSFIASHCLVNRKLNWWQKFLRSCNINIPNMEYGYVWSSGKPKSERPKGVESKTNSWNYGDHYYSKDIWKIEFDKIKSVIPVGYTIYGEIIGQSVQGPYTYGIEGTKLLVYKITTTNVDGVHQQLDWFSLKNFCQKYGLEHVEEWYVGKLGDLMMQTHSSIIESLTSRFLDRKTVCGNPDEGICIQKLSDPKWYKLKSFTFLKKESEMLDLNNGNPE